VYGELPALQVYLCPMHAVQPFQAGFYPLCSEGAEQSINLQREPLGEPLASFLRWGLLGDRVGSGISKQTTPLNSHARPIVRDPHKQSRAAL
jgi:hypothetical protein